MKVHEAARMVGVTPRTLRFYEEKGLISPGKESDNGYRSYSDQDIETLRWVISLRELGMSLAQIQEAIACLDEPELFIRMVDYARSSLHAELATAAESLRAFDETIAGWQRQGCASLEDARQAAERVKHNRALRSSWSDKWNYDEMALHYGYRAPLVALSEIIGPELYEHTLHRIVEWIDPRSHESGLELGAGSGNLTSLLEPACARLTAVEQSAEMIAILRERLPHIQIRQANLLALPLTGNQFDFIACSFAMQHLTREQQLLALDEMDLALKEGGRIVIAGWMSMDGNTEEISAAGMQGKSPGNKSGLTPSLLSELVSYLQRRSYSVVSERLSEQIGILCAAKQ